MGKYNERIKILLQTIGAIASVFSAATTVMKICISIISFLQQKSNRQRKG